MARTSVGGVIPVSVFVVVFPGFLLLDAAGPIQVFSTANDEAHDRGDSLPYRIAVVSPAGGAVRSSSGIGVQTSRLPPSHRLRGATVLVSGGQHMDEACADRRLVRWIGRARVPARRLGSVCSGAFLLAEAGVLDQCRAVTHWMDSSELRRRYPGVLVMDDPLFVKDRGVYTSAGISAGIDLCLALVEEDLGRAAALAVAKRLVVHHKRPGGQRQFSSALLAQSGRGSLAERLREWLRTRLGHSTDVASMAHAMAVSARTLHRRLRAEAGVTPAELLMRVRLEAACELAERGDLSFKQIAGKSGFGSEYNLRRAFVTRLGVTPREYRSRFG